MVVVYLVSRDRHAKPLVLCIYGSPIYENKHYQGFTTCKQVLHYISNQSRIPNEKKSTSPSYWIAGLSLPRNDSSGRSAVPPWRHRVIGGHHESLSEGLCGHVKLNWCFPSMYSTHMRVGSPVFVKIPPLKKCLLWITLFRKYRVGIELLKKLQT